MRLIAFCALLAMASPPDCCERRNPAVCSNDDGFGCSDDSQICDIKAGQTVGTCIDAECRVGASTNACPVDKSICISGRCTACSNDAQCGSANSAAPFCENSRCVVCRTSTDCSATPDTPACDSTTKTCRTCQLHSECASGVCAKDASFANLTSAPSIPKGRCVDASRVAIVDDAACGASCSLQAQLNKVTPNVPYILIKRHTSMAKITVPALPNGDPTFYIIGPMADIPPTKLTTAPEINLGASSGAALSIPAGANIVVEGLIFNGANGAGLDCAANGGATTIVRIIRSMFWNNGKGINATAMCELSIDSSWIGKGFSPVSNQSGNGAGMQLDSTKLDLVNSVLWKNGGVSFGGITLSDVMGLLPQVRIVNSTFAEQTFGAPDKALAIDCTTATFQGKVSVVNTLFANNVAPSPNVYVHANCLAAGNVAGVASNDATLTGTSTVTDVTDSVLVNPASGDLHFLPTAPTSVTTGGVTSFSGNGVQIPVVDMEGTPRGPSQISIGAFEKP